MTTPSDTPSTAAVAGSAATGQAELPPAAGEPTPN